MNSKGETIIESLSAVLIVAFSTTIITGTILFSTKTVENNELKVTGIQADYDYVLGEMLNNGTDYETVKLQIETEGEVINEQSIKLYRSEDKKLTAFGR